RSSRPYQTRETQDLALAQLEAHIGKNSRSSQMAHLKHHFPNLSLSLGEKIGEFASYHVLDDLFSRHLTDRGCNNMGAIAQDSQAVCYGENFFQAMANEEDGHATLAQLLYNSK